MLETIGHAGVADVIVVVTRYFGGILLGTRRAGARLHGGSLGCSAKRELVSMRLVVDCKVRVSYAQFEQAQRIIAAAETRLDEPIFDDAVTLCWRMPAGQGGGAPHGSQRADPRRGRGGNFCPAVGGVFKFL